MRSAALFALVLASALAMGCSGPRLARSRTVASAPGRYSQYVNPYTKSQAAKATPSSRTFLGYVPPPPPPPALNNFRPATRTVSTPVRATATTRTAPRSYTAPLPVRRTTVRRPARQAYRVPVVSTYADKDCNT